MIDYIVRKPVVMGDKPPVLVVLHGYGADEQDLMSIAEQLDPRFLVISLRAPIILPGGGYAWYHLAQTQSGLIPDDLSRHESEDAIAHTLSTLIEQEGGDAENVVLMGFSQGAAICYSLIIMYNLRNYGVHVRASVHMSGYLPRDILQPLSEKRFHDFPIFISHGEFDDLIPPMALNEAEHLLRERGADVTAHLYECGHGVVPETIEDVRAWLTKLEAVPQL